MALPDDDPSCHYIIKMSKQIKDDEKRFNFVRNQILNLEDCIEDEERRKTTVKALVVWSIQEFGKSDFKSDVRMLDLWKLMGKYSATMGMNGVLENLHRLGFFKNNSHFYLMWAEYWADQANRENFNKTVQLCEQNCQLSSHDSSELFKPLRVKYFAESDVFAGNANDTIDVIQMLASGPGIVRQDLTLFGNRHSHEREKQSMATNSIFGQNQPTENFVPNRRKSILSNRVELTPLVEEEKNSELSLKLSAQPHRVEHSSTETAKQPSSYREEFSIYKDATITVAPQKQQMGVSEQPPAVAKPPPVETVKQLQAEVEPRDEIPVFKHPASAAKAKQRPTKVGSDQPQVKDPTDPVPVPMVEKAAQKRPIGPSTVPMPCDDFSVFKDPTILANEPEHQKVIPERKQLQSEHPPLLSTNVISSPPTKRMMVEAARGETSEAAGKSAANANNTIASRRLSFLDIGEITIAGAHAGASGRLHPTPNSGFTTSTPRRSIIPGVFEPAVQLLFDELEQTTTDEGDDMGLFGNQKKKELGGGEAGGGTIFQRRLSSIFASDQQKQAPAGNNPGAQERAKMAPKKTSAEMVKTLPHLNIGSTIEEESECKENNTEQQSQPQQSKSPVPPATSEGIPQPQQKLPETPSSGGNLWDSQSMKDEDDFSSEL